MFEPKVSICMITYNHEAFITEAIEGVLMQKTSFPMKLMIGEDNSTDATRTICEEYAIKYPDVIELLPKEDQNLGMMPNFIRTLQVCTGEYIALCEGDDYWTDENKLQRQVDLLEENKKYSLCFTNAKIDEKNKINYLKDQTISFDDILKNNTVYTASAIFRKKDLPNDFYKLAKNALLGDWLLWLSILLDHKLGYILNEKMVYYRTHEGGVYSSLSYFRRKKIKLDFYIFIKDSEYFTKYKCDIDSIINWYWKSIISHSNKSDKIAVMNAIRESQLPKRYNRYFLLFLGNVSFRALRKFVWRFL